jgi:hypothetical protein
VHRMSFFSKTTKRRCSVLSVISNKVPIGPVQQRLRTVDVVILKRLMTKSVIDLDESGNEFGVQDQQPTEATDDSEWSSLLIKETIFFSSRYPARSAAAQSNRDYFPGFVLLSSISSI